MQYNGKGRFIRSDMKNQSQFTISDHVICYEKSSTDTKFEDIASGVHFSELLRYY